jgi:transcriptional regulator with XRE-family HTH domain
MDRKAFKIWLISNDLNQRTLAEKLKLTDRTISTYCKNERFPDIFLYALKGIEYENKIKK